MSRREQQANRVLEARHAVAVEISPLRGPETSVMSQQADDAERDPASFSSPTPSSSPSGNGRVVVASSRSPKSSSHDSPQPRTASAEAAARAPPAAVVATETPVAARLAERPHGAAAEALLSASPVYQQHVAATIAALERDIGTLQQERIGLLAKLDEAAARTLQLEGLVQNLSETVHHQATQIQQARDENKRLQLDLEAANKRADGCSSGTVVRPALSTKATPVQRPPSPSRVGASSTSSFQPRGTASTEEGGSKATVAQGPSSSRQASPSISRPTISSMRKSPAAEFERRLAERQSASTSTAIRPPSAPGSRQTSPLPRRVTPERRTQSPIELRQQLTTATFLRATASSWNKGVAPAASTSGAATAALGPSRPRLNAVTPLPSVASQHTTSVVANVAGAGGNGGVQGSSSIAAAPSATVTTSHQPRPCVHRSTTVIMRNGVPIAGGGSPVEDPLVVPRTVTPGRDRVVAAIARMVAPRVAVGRQVRD